MLSVSDGKHGTILNEGVYAAIDQSNWSMNILCGKLCDLVKLTGISKYTSRGFVVKHLKRLRSDNLKPVDKSFDARVGIQMSIRNNFLLEWYVLCGPAE